MRPITILTLAATTVAFVGCASAGQGGAAAGGGRNLITEDLIVQEGMDSYTAYEVVERLRGRWLRPTSAPSPSLGGTGGPRVYVNNVAMGGVEQLRSISARDVESMRFLNASDATFRYGTGHPAGAILVVTKTGPAR